MNAKPNTIIQVQNLSKSFGNLQVLKNISLDVYQGDVIAIIGPSGCGKSTLLRTLAELQPALNGTFSLAKNSVGDASVIALVLTERLSLENTTVHDVVAMGRYPYTSFLGGLSEMDKQIIQQSLEDVGLGDTAQSFFNDHSDGEKQRTLIAKALAQQTPIILLDEPTAHLDLPNRIRVLQLLRRVAREQQKTILISTHELDLAVKLSDRIMLMTPGKGIQLDTPDNLRQKDAFTTAFGMDIFNPI